MRINKIPALPAGEPIVDVTFNVDIDGILTVTGKLRGDEENVVTVDKINGGMKPEVIERAKKLTLKDYFTDFVDRMKAVSKDEAQKAKLGEADLTSLEVCIEQAEDFLAEGEHSMEEYEERQMEISEFFDPIMAKLAD